MKKILVFLIAVLFCASPTVYAQSAYQVLRTVSRVKFKAVPYGKISRHLQAPIASQKLAEQVASLTYPSAIKSYPQNRIKLKGSGFFLQPEVHIITQFDAPILSHPSSLWGSYQYMRVLTKLAQQPGAINPKYAKEWKRLHQVTSYNGVHHIVNQRTLKAIYGAMKHRAEANQEPFTLRLDELLRGAPASLHPFHGNPEYKTFFHNPERQMQLYEEGGIRAIVVDYFISLHRFHTKHPNTAPFIPTDVRKNTLLEAKLWAETFHLKWK